MLATDIPLIGRAEETARLHAGLAEAVSGRGRVMAIVGEAGVGKTRLVADLAAEVHTVSGRLLIGRCHESEQILPFGPWVDALGGARALIDQTWLATLPLVVRRELGRLLPELGSGDGETAFPPDYLKLFEGMALLLGHVADRQPTVLILEDLHWADEMSVRLMAFIGRRLRTWRLLVLVTARAEDLVDARMLQRTLAELERESHVATVALGPLSRSDADGLVQALSRPGSQEAAAARLSEQVWRTSEGNPLVVIETMRADAHEALSPGLEGLSLPERVRDIIGRQIDRLDELSRELVARAAVIGREFEFGLLQHVSGLDEEDAARGVEELIRQRVLQSAGERLDFTHDRVREVAYGRIVAPRRKVLHHRVAEALAMIHAGSLESHHLALGLHYAEGEVWDKAVIHLRRAGARAVERSANREALVCFERALAALAHLPDRRDTREQAFEIRLELRSVLTQLAETRQTVRRLREAEVLAERLSDDPRRGEVCAFLTNAHTLLGELDEALATGTWALEIAERLGDKRLRIATKSFPRPGPPLQGGSRTGGPADHRQPHGIATRLRLRELWTRRTGVDHRSQLAHQEPSRARPIRRRGPVRCGGHPARRAHASCLHRRFGLRLRGARSCAQGRVGGGARADRARNRRAPNWRRRRQPPLRDRLLGLGAGAARRRQRGVGPAPGGREASRSS
jgi:predicted ATPase